MVPAVAAQRQVDVVERAGALAAERGLVEFKGIPASAAEV
jgi:hypothetical protein